MADTPKAPETPEKPKSLIEKLGAAMPIALTALATAFAGMSSSELTRAMFWRTAAGQDQAKATNQWTFAGLKRNRSLVMETGAAQLNSVANFKAAVFKAPSEGASPETAEAIKWLNGESLPREKLPELDETILALTKAIRDRESEAEILKKADRIKPETINKAVDDLEKAVEEIDTRWDKVVKAAAKLVAEQSKASPADTASYRAAGFDLEQRRYRAESFFTQQIGFVYDARVRVLTGVSERFRKRSENFFFAMLAAQVGAVISSLALARKEASWLWLLAGLMGAVAVGFGAYVRLVV